MRNGGMGGRGWREDEVGGRVGAVEKVGVLIW